MHRQSLCATKVWTKRLRQISKTFFFACVCCTKTRRGRSFTICDIDSESVYFDLSNSRVSCQEYPFFSSSVLSFFFSPQCCSTLSARAIRTDVKSFFDRPNGRLFFFCVNRSQKNHPPQIPSAFILVTVKAGQRNSAEFRVCDFSMF